MTTNSHLRRAFLLAIFLLCWGECLASPEFNEANIIKALAGEAGGQSEAELIAHAHAIRNRGHLGGVYGFKAKVTPTALKMAKKAYAKSRLMADTVRGCDHWLSVYDLKHSRESLIAWRHKAVYKVLVGETWFYKLK